MGCRIRRRRRFAKTVDQLVELAPDRVALFSYAHVPWLKKQQGAFAMYLPEGMQKFEIFRVGLQKFLEAGYLYIGMDHFAKPGDELAVAQRERTLHRNFQGYTTKAGADLFGMGVTAISGIQDAYAQNHRDLAVVGEGGRRSRDCDDARLSSFGRRSVAAVGDQPVAVPHADHQG